MAKRNVPPSRKRYEEEHPSLTVRVPAAVKARIAELARAEGLSVSEWVQAAAAQHEADPAEAHRRGRDEGYAKGERAGKAEGRRAGIAVGAQAGVRVGILLDCMAREDGRMYDAGMVARKLAEPEELREVVWTAARMFGKEDDLRRYVGRLLRGRR